jgi:hypothetical protein
MNKIIPGWLKKKKGTPCRLRLAAIWNRPVLVGCGYRKPFRDTPK